MRKRLSEEEWAEIQAEWETGQIDMTLVARRFGIDRSAITQRAKRKGWPPRNSSPAVVKGIVKRDNSAEPVTNSRTALQAFARVMDLLIQHRGEVATLRSGISAQMKRIEVIIRVAEAKNEPLTLNQEVMIAQMFSAWASALARVIPIERRAFGLTDQDGPSEFDGFTDEEIKIVETALRIALGR